MKKLLFFVLTLTLTSSINTFAHDIKAVNADGVTIYYNWINDSTELAVSFRTESSGGGGYYIYREYTGNVVIPDSVTYNGVTYGVTSIGAEAFAYCKGLISVTIPNSVISIGDHVFHYCSGPVFGYCSELSAIIVEKGNVKYDSRDNCNAIIETNSNNLIAGCKKTIIPPSVTGIAANAFLGCDSLNSVYIPAGITSIERSAFQNCISLSTIIVAPENPRYDSRDSCNAIIETGTDMLLVGCKNTIIPNSVTSIGQSAFFRCTGLKSIAIPDNVIFIGNSAFENCEGLSSVSTGNGVDNIANSTFRNCKELKSLTIGSNVKLIHSRAFRGVYNLNNIISLNPVPPTITNVFQKDTYNAFLQVPIGSLQAYLDDDAWKNFSNIIEVDFSLPIACYINATNFPDERFRNYLLNEPFGKDGVLTEDEIAGIRSLDVSNLGISDLKGIEYFTALKKLLCYKNNLTSLDLSANKQLTEVDCYSNQIIGSKMDSLLASLPTLNDEEGSLYVFDATNDGNICFVDQVTFANSKGWAVYYYTGSDWKKYAGKENGILIAEENFPDENFRKYLLEQDYGKDMIIADDEIKSITAIYVGGEYMGSNNRNITSLKGIEHLTSLKTIVCNWNKLTSLDISNNIELTELYCGYNQLEELDVSNNKALEFLYCSSNELKSLDVSNNMALTVLQCDRNGLTQLDVSKNELLTSLSCSYNQLTSLDISKNKALNSLACVSTQLTDLDVSKNTELTSLSCANNQLSFLDVSKNAKLTYVACMRNQLTKLDVSKNKALKWLNCKQNRIDAERMYQMIEGLPNQTSGTLCVRNKYGSDENVCTKSLVKVANAKGWKVMCSHEGSGWYPGTSEEFYEEYEGSDCDDVFVDEENFPDSIFRDYLLSQEYVRYGVIFRNKVADITNINVTHKGITTLKGIEFFTSLKSLSCGQTRLTTLDVSNNTELTWLETYGAPLTSLNVSGCKALQYLGSYWGQLTTLDLSECTSLETLVCKGNQLTSLDVSKNKALKYLNCEGNLLTSLNVSGCTALRYLECFGNQLAALNVSGCKELTRLYCYQNQIEDYAMDALIEGLPNSSYCDFRIIYNNEKEGNIMTTMQAAAAKEKGWTPLYTNDGLLWQEYFGSDPTDGQTITFEKDTIEPVYDLNGRKLKKPSKGINIIGGKKVLLK